MKKKLVKIIVWSAAVTVLLFVVLVVHIVIVTKPVQYDNNDLQLSRIDFKQPIDSAEAVKIRSFVAHLPGVQNALFNLHDRTLVYGYTLGKQSSANVYERLMNFGHYKAVCFVPNATQLSGGCPVGKDKSAFIYKLAAFVSKCFH